jgi:multiple sugar transport system permease protein
MSGVALRRSLPANGLFVLPFMVVYVLLVLWPLIKGMMISLHDHDLLSDDSFYVGLQNFAELAGDEVFLKATLNTVKFVAISTPVFVAASLALAVALNRPGKLGAVLRGTFFCASVFSVTIVTLVWRLALMPERGLHDVSPLNSEWLALPTLAVVTVWWIVGLPMIVFLAALQQIPPDIYEAAALDNAGRWRTLTRITMPMLSRTIMLVTVVEIIRQFQVFPQMFLMTSGGPNNSTRSIVQFVYEQAFMDLSLGYASAASQVLFAVMLVGVALQLWLERERRTTP